MIDRVEIAQDADGTAEGAEEKLFLGSSIQPDCGALLQEERQGEKHRKEITENGLLGRGLISGKVDE